MKRKQRRKLIWMVAGLAVLLYLGLAVYFHNHFFPKTTLNGRKAGGYTAQKVMDEITEEIRAIHEACAGKVLKVIIETCLLTEEEKIAVCRVVSMSGADFIKTSTGFSTGIGRKAARFLIFFLSRDGVDTQETCFRNGLRQFLFFNFFLFRC